MHPTPMSHLAVAPAWSAGKSFSATPLLQACARTFWEGCNSIPQVCTHSSHEKSVACETNSVQRPSSPYPALLVFDREIDEVSMRLPRILTVANLHSGGHAVGG
ncbi:hypothetical protein OH76DRAFT_1070284 [Lentinus brumalis]|uniref:Uncharacterized protein n=1 Tax=Lentinus brumalis TaxID=2498619 RepID=A0A371DNT8_9APHY|nr:hypothetical protein OH76DRAFT_1070284 [Polyporus brumalis]